MSILDAIRLALTQIRVQKLKSFFTLLGVTIGVMFLIAVVSIVNGMSKYMEEDFAAKFLGVNTFTLRRFPDFNMGNVTEAMWKEWQRRPLITVEDAEAVRDALPANTHWAIQDMTWGNPSTSYRNGGPQSLVRGRVGRLLPHQESRRRARARVHRAGGDGRRAGRRDREGNGGHVLPEHRSARARDPARGASLPRDRRARETGKHVRASRSTGR